MDAMPSLLDRLIANGVLIPSGVDGIYARSGRFEAVVDALDALVVRTGAVDNPEVLRFPPAMVTEQLVKSGYLKSFPQLLGTIHCFCGNEADHRKLLRCVDENQPWMDQQQSTDLLMTPAACYPVYPLVARRGQLPHEGALFDIHSWCFRHEPSLDPARMQCFRLHEFVRIGSNEQVLEFRQVWFDRAQAVVNALALPYTIDIANDPFFGRAGRLVADNQREQKLKYELLVPVASEEKPTACMSFNYHLDHFGEPWNIRTAGGAVANSGCVGFGLERITLALFRHHGMDPSDWPHKVRSALRLDA
jgi:seryl-tRNA synthetase